MRVEDLNELPRELFVEELGWVFEQSPWVAERVWERRPFASREALHRAMVDEVERATREEQMALLRAHPDLGSRLPMSAASAMEQTRAGLGSMTSEEFENLYALNAAYR